MNRDKLRKELHRKQRGRCLVCRRQLSWRKKNAGRAFYATLDHTIPRFDLGTSEESNMAILCQRCNRLKGKRIISYALLALELADARAE